MRSIVFLIALVFFVATCSKSKDPVPASNKASSKTGDIKSDGFVLLQKHPQDGELKSLLKSEALVGTKAGRKVFVYIKADWCPPCVKLRESLGDSRMKAAFHNTHIIQLDLNEYGSDKLDTEGLPSGSIPVFHEIDAKGRPTGRKIDGGAWGENIPKNMAPPLKAFFQAE
ncbi:MAG: thioredoxin family protein [Spirochaetota bacterium]